MVHTQTGLTDRFIDAVAMAHREHRADVRKGTTIPYVAHLMSVCALVLEHGGSEDQAIAAMLHDVAEDHGGQPMIDEIRLAFGSDVADIVVACSDSLIEDPKGKLAWWPRKVAYLDHLAADAPGMALPVSVADKLHNARSILADYRTEGDALWERFNSHAGRAGSLWYYTQLVEIYAARIDDGAPAVMVDELRCTVDAICDHATSLDHDVVLDLQQAHDRELQTRGEIR